MAKIYLILGGTRSGKSSFGEELATSLPGKTGYLATAKIVTISDIINRGCEVIFIQRQIKISTHILSNNVVDGLYI